MNLRFRKWGTTEWTTVNVDGELEPEALSVLGSGLARYHVQVLTGDGWENLW